MSRIPMPGFGRFPRLDEQCNAQNRSAPHIFERQVDLMGLLIDSDAMGFSCHKLISYLVYTASLLVKEGYGTALTGDIELMPFCIEGQDIGSLSYGLYRNHLHGMQHID